MFIDRVILAIVVAAGVALGILYYSDTHEESVSVAADSQSATVAPISETDPKVGGLPPAVLAEKSDVRDIEAPASEAGSLKQESLPIYTAESLARYNGDDPSLPIYVAFEQNVYDVTDGKRFYGQGGAYHFLAGTDGTTMLRIAGGETIRKKYPIVGLYSP